MAADALKLVDMFSGVCVCMYVCMYVWMYVYMHQNTLEPPEKSLVCTYVYNMHIHAMYAHTYIHERMYAHTYIHTYNLRKAVAFIQAPTRCPCSDTL